MQYDMLGRVRTFTITPDNETTVYTYNTMSNYNGFGQLNNVIKTLGDGSQVKTAYTYDALDRVSAKTETIDGNSYTFTYGYSSLNGMAERYIFPTGYQVTYQYNTLGYMNKVTDVAQNVLWQATADNARGQLTETAYGNGLFTHYRYDDYGYPILIRTNAIRGNGDAALPVMGEDGLPEAVAGNIQDDYYTFNSQTGNLSTKYELTNNDWLGETYTYDSQLKDRLTGWRAINNSFNYTMQYAANGNIQTKSDVTQGTGQYNYGQGAGPHAVTSITNATNTYITGAVNHEIIYNGINKVAQVEIPINSGTLPADHIRMRLTYGNDDERIKAENGYVYQNQFAVTDTKYYFDNFEVKKVGNTGSVEYLHYLICPQGTFAIVELKNNVYTTRYIHTDYQGSYQVISDAQGNKLEYLAYDPWGKRRNPSNWSYSNVPATFVYDRGYTGHEHLDKYGLINMNGRVYDPNLGRFLSPDPYLQDAGNLQNFNRYSYCLNNPLKYTDPSGYTVYPREKNFGYASGDGYNYNSDNINGNYTLTKPGYIGPGSGYHWSDQTRSVYGNFFMMRSATFQNYYGISNDDYFNKIVNGYESLSNNNSFNLSSKGGFWIDIHKNHGSNMWVRTDKINYLEGDEVISEFIRTNENKNGTDDNVYNFFSDLIGVLGVNATAVTLYIKEYAPERIIYYAFDASKKWIAKANIIENLESIAKKTLIAGLVIDGIHTVIDPDFAGKAVVNGVVNYGAYIIGGTGGLVIAVGYLALDKSGMLVPGTGIRTNYTTPLNPSDNTQYHNPYRK